MKRIMCMAAFALSLAAPAAGQRSAQVGSDIDNFINAIEDRDGAKGTQLLASSSPALIDQRGTRGVTPLLVAIEAHDPLWTQFLLGRGASPNVAARSGETPLIAASRIGFMDAVEWLLAAGADVNGTNRMGETALIIAVQQRQRPIVRLLMARGANPDIADHAAGLSAREYAKRDTRNRDLLKLIEAGKPGS